MKVCIESIGCKVNYYEAEAIKNILLENGHKIVHDNFDVYILNSCALTTAASSKSRQKIRSIKRNHPGVWTILTGCLAEEAQHRVLDWGIDLVVGNEFKKDMDKIIKDINTTRYVLSSYDIRTQDLYTAPSLLGSFSRKRAYVMVQDGCDNYCRYCKIPYLRGRARSRCMEDILLEAKKLLLAGFQELVIVGINIGSYKYNNINLIKLLERIIKLEKINRIRLSSIEPQYITDEFIKFLSSHQTICNHLHIPLQSGDDYILRLMGRKYNTSFYTEVIEKLREKIDNLAVTTDVIVGFPGEEENNFLNTYEFIKKIKFSKIHTFRYSNNPFTSQDLSRLKQVSECVKKERAMQIAKLGRDLSLEYRRSFEGKEVEVLIEEIKGTILKGTTREYIKVLIDTKKTKKTYTPYTLIKAKIKYIDGENTYAEIMPEFDYRENPFL